MAKTQVIFIENETITLNSKGIWLSDGIEIEHSETTRAFYKYLSKDSAGYFLKIGSETKRITVEDTAFFILAIRGTPNEGYDLFATDDRSYRLLPETLRYSPGRLTCEIHSHLGLETARFLSAAYLDLLQNLKMDSGKYSLQIEGKIIHLSPVT